MAMGKRIVEKVTARVFTCPGGVVGGGNPVTVFLSQGDNTDSLPLKTQISLAKSCEWESVVAHLSANRPRLSFFMPSGEEVSFCAHAAMGALWATFASRGKSSRCEYDTSMSRNVVQTATIDKGKEEVGLHMHTQWTEEPINDRETLDSIFQDQLMLKGTHDYANNSWPSFCNSSVARPKTLVYLDSLEDLHSIPPPRDAPAFCDACDTIHSTGLYFYARRSRDNDTDWECRQFPRASGYPEDPATGIAAAALAVSLHNQNFIKEQGPHIKSITELPATYNIYQGTAMLRPSLIRIQDIQIAENNQVQLKCFGHIEVDEKVEIIVDI